MRKVLFKMSFAGFPPSCSSLLQVLLFENKVGKNGLESHYFINSKSDISIFDFEI
jgi:hypothetical protein